MIYIKYSDDTVIMITTNTNVLQHKLDTFSSWCTNNCLDLNVSKNQTSDHLFPPWAFHYTQSVTNEIIEEVHSYKYPSIIIDHKFTFHFNSEYLFGKCQQHLQHKGSMIATHIFHRPYSLLPSGQRFRSLLHRKKRATSNVVPTSSQLLNS